MDEPGTEVDRDEDASLGEEEADSLPILPELDRAISRTRLAVHLVLACVLSAGLHLLLAGSLELGASEALMALAAHDGAWYAVGAPLSALFVALGMAIGGPEAIFVRLPSVIVWIAIPILVAAVCLKASGRRAAVRGAWLLCALPLAHVTGVFAGPGLFLFIAYGCSALVLVGIVRRIGSAASATGPAPVSGLVDGLLLGAAGAVAVLAAPCGWLLPLANASALIISWSSGDRRKAIVAALLAIVLPIGVFAIAGLLLGDLRWALPTAPSLSSVHAGEILPPSRFLILVPILLIGLGPLIFLPLVSWGNWARRPLPAGPRRAARALLILGALPLLVLLSVSVFLSVDTVNVAAPFLPLIAGLAAWKSLGRWFLRIALSSGALVAVAALQLLGTISVLPEERDPAGELKGWGEVGEGVEVWCNIVPDDGAARVMAEPVLAARLVFSAPACEPIGFIGGPEEMKRSELRPGSIFLLVHRAGEKPTVPASCEAGIHAAPVGPPSLGIVVSPSRCDG